MRRISQGEKITAKWANDLLDLISCVRITSVIGGRLTRNSGGGMTLSVATPRSATGRPRGDADVPENEAAGTHAESKSVESKAGRGRLFSLFNFLKPAVSAMPEDKSKFAVLVRDGSGEVPTLGYVGMQEFASASLPAGTYDKDALIWDNSKMVWTPVKTAVINAVIGIRQYGADIQMQQQKVRVIVDAEATGWETIFTGENCKGFYA